MNELLLYIGGQTNRIGLSSSSIPHEDSLQSQDLRPPDGARHYFFARGSVIDEGIIR